MQKKHTENLLNVLKKTHAHSAEPAISPVWKNSVMAEVYASGISRQIPFVTKIAPRVALAAVIMLVVLGVPTLLTVDNLIHLLDSELMKSASDTSEFWMML